jgi:hypothetical protein
VKDGSGRALEVGDRKLEEESAMIKRRSMNRRPSGDEDWTKIEPARKGRGSPAVLNKFRSRLIKELAFYI